MPAPSRMPFEDTVSGVVVDVSPSSTSDIGNDVQQILPDSDSDDSSGALGPESAGVAMEQPVSTLQNQVMQ